MKESEPILVNMLWNMVRNREIPLTLDINGSHCSDEKVLADKFAEHLMSEQNLHPTATVPQQGESFSFHYWKFKYVSPEDVRSRMKSLKPKNSVGPDGIIPAFIKKIVNGISANIANLINIIIASGNYP